MDYETETLVAHSLRGGGFDASEDGTGRGTPLVPVAFSCKNHGNDAQDDLSSTLRSMNFDKSHANAGGQVAVAFQSRASSSNTMNPTDIVPSLDVGKAGGMAISVHQNQRGGDKPGQGYPAVAQAMSVRRLTPKECERLQGFPDDYTLVPYRNGMAADGPRYKALGNSMAVPCMRWIGERIQAVNAL